MRTLVLPLKGEYFDAIKAGIKPEEFRAATPYWRRRLDGQSFVCIPVMLTPSSSDCDPPVLEVLPHPFQWL
jgi:hypothetical protein